ncbi:response regulator transcription factor [Chitinilyticum piscinae]|uniref:Response regulator transcription factor n=1 Tax=Chitinilyticum piscinae TaxID=2866724 RepID=A0A8J7FQ42_9NEIS|nr:response regulator [Chitinilyticum piscinae]MBE9610184.1 response regulator transcription factor [Chitinilyticum piscinae]
MNPSPRIAVIDDDVAVCDSLDLLFETRQWPVRTFASAEAFLADARLDDFGCLIVDVRMAGMSGLELFARLKEEHGYVPPVIFLTGHGDVPMAVNAVKEGASDFLEKPFDHHQLLAKVEACLARDAAVRTSRSQQDSVLSRLEELTPRERQVLREILAGKLNKQVADRLDISIKTVEVHRARIFTKMRVHSAMELAAMLKDIPLETWCPSA